MNTAFHFHITAGQPTQVHTFTLPTSVHRDWSTPTHTHPPRPPYPLQSNPSPTGGQYRSKQCVSVCNACNNKIAFFTVAITPPVQALSQRRRWSMYLCLLHLAVKRRVCLLQASGRWGWGWWCLLPSSPSRRPFCRRSYKGRSLFSQQIKMSLSGVNTKKSFMGGGGRGVGGTGG